MPESLFKQRLSQQASASPTLLQTVEAHPYLTLVFPLTAAGLLAMRAENWQLGALGGAACFAGAVATAQFEATSSSSSSLKNANLPTFIAERPVDAATGFFLGTGLSFAVLAVFDDIVFMLIPRSWLSVLSLAGGVGGVAAFWWIVTRWSEQAGWGDNAPKSFSDWFQNLVLLSPIPGLVLQEITMGKINWGDWVKGLALNNPPVAIGSIIGHKIDKSCTLV